MFAASPSIDVYSRALALEFLVQSGVKSPGHSSISYLSIKAILLL